MTGSEYALIAWQPPADNGCPVTGYTVAHRFIRHRQCPATLQDGEGWNGTAVAPSAMPQHSITGLRPFAEYVVVVRVMTADGLSASSSVKIETRESSK